LKILFERSLYYLLRGISVIKRKPEKLIFSGDVYVMQTLKGKPKHLKTVDTNCFYCDNDLNVLDQALGMLDFESL
jgi:hypothetical protein